VDQDVAKTLGELERKLLELERTLTAIGHDGEPAGGAGQPLGGAGQPFGDAGQAVPEAGQPVSDADQVPNSAGPSGFTRLVDETVERRRPPSAGIPAAQAAHTSPPPRPPQPQRPRQALQPLETSAATRAPRPVQTPSPGQAPAPEQPPGRPQVTDHSRPPSAAELLSFRDRLGRTARELTHDYDELLGRLSFAAMPAHAGPTISFARGAPSLDIVDVQGLSDAAVRAFESDPGGATAYGTSVGYPRLRSWIADRHGVEPERVLVTNGSMQADAFLFEHLVRPGDEVLIESPTYDRTLLSLRQRGARLHAIALEPDGIDTDALTRLLGGATGARPRLAHIIPNFQNPAGYTLSLRKRQTLLELAAAYGFVVFEDDPYVALRFSGQSLPTMLSMDPERVVYASSFSKTICPGIRVGYLIGPPEVIDAVTLMATNTYISPDMVAQAIVYEFCAAGAIDRSIETVRAALSERAQALGNALRREMAEAEFVAPEGGYFMWVTLPHGTDVHALFQAAAERGVSFVKGTDFLLEGGENTLRLAYSGVTPEQIDEGVARLAAAFRSLA
jgi:2-aminoadipate transaminase